LENYVRDVQTQLNHEKKEIVAKISRCNFYLEESSSSQELDRKLADCKKTKLAVMNDAEKQQIMTNISSIHTEQTVTKGKGQENVQNSEGSRGSSNTEIGKLCQRCTDPIESREKRDCSKNLSL
jgi:hypothetical protein